ncbi:MAG: lytic murein transglycosylase, partial [Actinomycetota bacterium]|nr:lytic murein transglycosylase [Actinomycetota bacterium]
MSRRKLFVALIVAGLVSAGLGSSVLSVSAEPQINLPTGKSITLPIPGACTPLPPLITCDQAPGSPAPSTTTPAPQPTAPPATPTLVTPQSDGSTPRQTVGSGKEKGKAQPKRTAGPTLGKRHTDDVKPKRGTNGQPRAQDGQPTVDNPTFSFAQPGAAPLGVPNFFIEKFRIPPFLLPIYQAAGTEYAVPWQVLAAINEIETDYGRNLSVSSAGAMGWMQFIPSSWQTYGVDANGDGKKDPYNPVDAIFAAARYLRAAGGDQNVSKAIFAYNHADWYVQSVLVRAKLIGGIPADLIGSLTGLTQGHFPVAATATYADDLNEKRATRRVHSGNAAVAVNAKAGRREINIFARSGAPVIAVNDGVIRQVGKDRVHGRFVVLQDVSGNTYTYSHLGQIAPSFPSPRQEQVQPSAKQLKSDLELPPKDAAPSQAASGGKQVKNAPKSSTPSSGSERPGPSSQVSAGATASKERLFAHPGRSSAYRAGGDQQLLGSGRPVAGYDTFDSYVGKVLGLKRSDVTFKALRPGAQVIAGTILGRIDRTDNQLAPHVGFSLRPTGRGAPQVDPKPILDGWKLLEATAVYRASDKNPFWGRDAKSPSIGQILLMSKAQLEKRVLSDPRIEIYACGRSDIQAHIVDHRVLALLEFLAASGLRPYASTLKCGHSLYIAGGGAISEHSYGDAVDIAKINGIPILGHQGAGS